MIDHGAISRKITILLPQVLIKIRELGAARRPTAIKTLS
jgi:hypothetical protein